MDLHQAHDVLSHMVMLFHNEMIRNRIEDMTPRQWAEKFRSWFDVYEFERHHDMMEALFRRQERDDESS